MLSDVVGKPSAAQTAVAARLLEIFLDRLAWKTATLSAGSEQYLLDDRYAGVKRSQGDQLLQQELLAFLERVPPEAKAGTAWQVVGGALRDLGASTADLGMTIDSTLSDALRVLHDGGQALPPAALATQQLDSAGIYSWWVDDEGAAALTAGLGYDVSGLIYAGETGGSSSGSGVAGKSTLRQRLLDNHMRGNISASTFRRTLAAALRAQLPSEEDVFGQSAERALTEWMTQHLTVVAYPVADRDTVLALEKYVVQNLNPPLNLQYVDKTPTREELRRRRGRLS